MGKIEINTEIEALIEKVFAFLADPRTGEKVLPKEAEVKIELLSEGPFGIGTKSRFSGMYGGRKILSESEWVVFEEN